MSPTQPFAAGALVGTVHDLAKWDAALYGDSLLPTSALSEMWTPVKLNDGKTAPYGYGWQVGEIRGHRYVGHGGGIHGFSTYILRLVDDRLTVIVLMNAGGNPEAVARGIAGQTVQGLTLATVKPGKDPHPELSERLKKCLADMAAKKDSDMLTPEFRENFSRSRRRHAAVQEDIPALKSFRFVTSDKPTDREREIRGATIEELASYKITDGDRSRFYTFALTAEGKVAQFEMGE